MNTSNNLTGMARIRAFLARGVALEVAAGILVAAACLSAIAFVCYFLFYLFTVGFYAFMFMLRLLIAEAVFLLGVWLALAWISKFSDTGTPPQAPSSAQEDPQNTQGD